MPRLILDLTDEQAQAIGTLLEQTQTAYRDFLKYPKSYLYGELRTEDSRYDELLKGFEQPQKALNHEILEALGILNIRIEHDPVSIGEPFDWSDLEIPTTEQPDLEPAEEDDQNAAPPSFIARSISEPPAAEDDTPIVPLAPFLPPNAIEHQNDLLRLLKQLADDNLNLFKRINQLEIRIMVLELSERESIHYHINGKSIISESTSG